MTNVFFPKYVEKAYTECLQCQSQALEVVALHTAEASPELMLPKRNLKMLRSSRGVPLNKITLWLCHDCGLLFRETDPRELQFFLKKYNKD